MNLKTKNNLIAFQNMFIAVFLAVTIYKINNSLGWIFIGFVLLKDVEKIISMLLAINKTKQINILSPDNYEKP